MTRLPLAIVIVSLLATACRNEKHASAPARRPSTFATPQQMPMTEVGRTPSDVSYSIIHSRTVPGRKRAIEVQLNKKVSEDVLRAIALELRGQDPGDYQRTFIAYYLPGMTVGAGAWATTHFTPNLEVRILGVKKEQEKELQAESIPSDREVIGCWLVEMPGLAGRITIFREGANVFIERKFTDGSCLKEQLVEKRTSLGHRFDKVDGSSAGDHWLVDSRGNLQIRDNDGVIGTAKKIE